MDYDPKDRRITWRDALAGAGLYLFIVVAVILPGSLRPAATGQAVLSLAKPPESPSHSLSSRNIFHRLSDRRAAADVVRDCPLEGPEET